MFRGDGNELLQVDLLDVLLAALLDDEDCRAAEVCAQLDFVCACLRVHALLRDGLTEVVHEHCRGDSCLSCGECGVYETRLDVHEHLGLDSAANRSDGTCTAECDNLA